MSSRGEDTSDTSAGVARDGSAHFVGRSGLAGRALHFDFARKRVRVTDVFESGAGQVLARTQAGGVLLITGGEHVTEGGKVLTWTGFIR